MRKKQMVLLVTALFFMVTIGGCGGGAETQSDLEKMAESLYASPADSNKTYTFTTGGVVKLGEMEDVSGQKSGRNIYDDCLRITMACDLEQARVFFDLAEITAVNEDGQTYNDSTFFINGDEKSCALTIECPTEEKVKYITIDSFKPNFDGDKTKLIFERKNAGT
ncbi:hypothetical protein [Eubacterium sp. 1001713B170207_170306_E7]|uniref:hypothetical protein n=1 Tax=Eubacterium sp. 1001713B170207_170306_E7 TaxID=2787097 RepID=UPI0018987432|nr:hypothetical protein [Eubacterium sp. 1001713B170207_170306_E7]